MESNPAISIEQLNRYLDGELTEKDKLEIEEKLRSDSELQSRLDNLLIARAAIKSSGLKDRISGIYSDFKAAHGAKVVPLKKRYLLKAWISVAAALLLLILGYGAYQLITVSNQSVFDEHYMAYYLPVQRGAADPVTSLRDSLYRAGDYAGYLEQSKNISHPVQKDHFLEGMALLETNEPEKAIISFEKLKDLNAKGNDPYFEQETDYYLTLAFIRSGRIGEAKVLLEKIKSNPQHLYYKNASSISNLSLKVLGVKN